MGAGLLFLNPAPLKMEVKMKEKKFITTREVDLEKIEERKKREQIIEERKKAKEQEEEENE